MSWHFSQALEGAFSEACSLDGALSAPWKSIPFAPDDYSSAKMKGTCHRSPFGMMFVPSTDAHGEALLTWFRGAFPAKTSALQEKEQESTESEAGSGVKWPASFARYDRDTRSWKTAQLSLFEDLEQSLETWPRWGWMHDGECSVQSTQAPHTDEKESGLLPTPTGRGKKIVPTPRVQMHRSPPEDRMGVDSENYHSNLEEFACGQLNPTWVEWLMGWPIGWTACEPLVMDKFRQWLLGHGRHYRCMRSSEGIDNYMANETIFVEKDGDLLLARARAESEDGKTIGDAAWISRPGDEDYEEMLAIYLGREHTRKTT